MPIYIVYCADPGPRPMAPLLWPESFQSIEAATAAITEHDEEFNGDIPGRTKFEWDSDPTEYDREGNEGGELAQGEGYVFRYSLFRIDR